MTQVGVLISMVSPLTQAIYLLETVNVHFYNKDLFQNKNKVQRNPPLCCNPYSESVGIQFGKKLALEITKYLINCEVPSVYSSVSCPIQLQNPTL